MKVSEQVGPTSVTDCGAVTCPWHCEHKVKLARSRLMRVPLSHMEFALFVVLHNPDPSSAAPRLLFTEPD